MKTAKWIADGKGPGFDGLYELSEPFIVKGGEETRVYVRYGQLYGLTDSNAPLTLLRGTPDELLTTIGYTLVPHFHVDAPESGHVNFKLAVEDIVSKHKKPPIGLTPKQLWMKAQRGNVRSRAQEIAGAIQRYAAAGLPIPAEWTSELLQRLGEIDMTL